MTYVVTPITPQKICPNCKLPGEFHKHKILVLDFDHVRGEKLFNIGSAAASGRSIEDIQAEIKKCEVRCANDHRRKTAKQFNQSKLAWLQKRSN